ncbi:Uncharacterised protein [Mycobacterium tuberculosis]|nr:Uncharacterised protein [Mycobacterium tuberculosis]
MHEPSGIMLRSRAISLSASARKYRIIDVSVRYCVNAGCVRNSDVRVAMSVWAGAAGATPNASRTTATWVSVVASSQATDTWSASTRHRLMPLALALASTSSARPGTRANTVSKYLSCTNASPSAPAIASAWACTRRAMAVSPPAPW